MMHNVAITDVPGTTESYIFSSATLNIKTNSTIHVVYRDVVI